MIVEVEVVKKYSMDRSVLDLNSKVDREKNFWIYFRGVAVVVGLKIVYLFESLVKFNENSK